MNRREQEAHDLMRRCLQGFPYYRIEHILYSIERGESLFISYMEEVIGDKPVDQNLFRLQIKGGICDVSRFVIRTDLRRQGHGRNLFSVIESFCEKYEGVELLYVTPSGQGAKFWPKMGFTDL